MGKIRSFSPHRRWTDAEIAVLRSHYYEGDWAEICTLLPGRGSQSIKDKAFGLGLKRYRAPKRNRAEYLAAKRDGAARWRESNPDKSIQRGRDFYARNREAILAKSRDANARRLFWSRAQKLRGIGAKDLASLWRRQRGMCALTGRKLDRSAQVDHIVPRARGGGDEISNLQWLCAEANLAKRDMTDQEFIAMCDEIYQFRSKG